MANAPTLIFLTETVWVGKDSCPLIRIFPEIEVLPALSNSARGRDVRIPTYRLYIDNGGTDEIDDSPPGKIRRTSGSTRETPILNMSVLFRSYVRTGLINGPNGDNKLLRLDNSNVKFGEVVPTPTFPIPAIRPSDATFADGKKMFGVVRSHCHTSAEF